MQDPPDNHRKSFNCPGEEPPLWSTGEAVLRWQGGDESAFVEIHQRFSRLLAIRIRHSPSWPLLAKRYEVDDVVQEVWARVLPTVRETFEPSGKNSFLGFLRTVADRCVIDLIRRLGAEKRGQGRGESPLDTKASSGALPRPGLPSIETPTSQARSSELHDIARQELSEREFLAWDLVEMQAYTTEEASLAMGDQGGSSSAVRGVLKRARVKLVMRLERESR